MLVMVAHHRSSFAEAIIAQGEQDALSDHRVLLHGFPFVLHERRGFLGTRSGMPILPMSCRWAPIPKISSSLPASSQSRPSSRLSRTTRSECSLVERSRSPRATARDRVKPEPGGSEFSSSQFGKVLPGDSDSAVEFQFTVHRSIDRSDRPGSRSGWNRRNV